MKATAAVLYELKKPVVIEDVELLESGPPRGAGPVGGQRRLPQRLSRDHRRRPPSAAGRARPRGGRAWSSGSAPAWRRCKPGDHVCSSYIPSCGRCGYCIGGQPTMCALRDKPRWFMLDGTSRFRKGAPACTTICRSAGYATHSVLPEASVIPIRKDAPLDVACLVSCGVLAGAGPVFNRAKVPPGASVAVWGCGGVGLNTIQAARLVGAGKIIAVDVMPQKLAWAEEFGATHVVNAADRGPGRARAGDQRHRRRGLRVRDRRHPGHHGAGAARRPTGAAPASWSASRPAGTRLSDRPQPVPAAAHPHRQLLRRWPPAHRRADADRPLHVRPVTSSTR